MERGLQAGGDVWGLHKTDAVKPDDHASHAVPSNAERAQHEVHRGPLNEHPDDRVREEQDEDQDDRDGLGEVNHECKRPRLGQLVGNLQTCPG